MAIEVAAPYIKSISVSDEMDDCGDFLLVLLQLNIVVCSCTLDDCVLFSSLYDSIAAQFLPRTYILIYCYVIILLD